MGPFPHERPWLYGFIEPYFVHLSAVEVEIYMRNRVKGQCAHICAQNVHAQARHEGSGRLCESPRVPQRPLGPKKFKKRRSRDQR